MFYPGYMGDIPADFLSHPDYRGSANFIEFAVKQGWYDPDSGKPFNVDRVYRTADVRYPRKEVEQSLRAAAPVDLKTMMAAVRDPRMSKDATGYGQVAQLRADTPADLRTLWVAPTGSVTAPFLPWRIGATRVPPEFGRHRYLGKGEGKAFLTEDWQIQEATLFAGRLFKRLMYYTCDRPAEFLPEVTKALTAFEARMIAEQPAIERTWSVLAKAGERDLARATLTRYLDARARDALDVGAALLGSIETRTRLQYGLRRPAGDEISRLDYQQITCLP